MDTVGPPGQRVIKGPAKRKKTRRRQTKQRNTSNDIFGMELVHPNSCECTKSEMDFFEVPPTQTSVEHGYWEQKGLTSALTDQGPYEFAVSGTGTTTSTWLILTCLWKHRSWLTTILHWMPERTLDLSTYGCIPSLVMSVLASTKIWFHHRPACTLTELT